MCFGGLSHKLLFFILFLKCLSLIDCNKPKLSVISGQTSLIDNKTVIDITTNATLRLKCEGKQPIIWSFPENDPYLAPIVNLTKINSKCIKSNKCFSEMSLPSVQFWQTGQYSCRYKISKNMFDSIYVFVNDPDNLIVPVEGNDEFLVVSVLENRTNFLIPCKPTDSKAIVSLHLYDTQNENFVQMPNKWMTFDPTMGFIVNRIESQKYHDIDCRVKSGQKEQYIAITIHLIKLTHLRLFPYINVKPNDTKIGDNITLTCLVNIAANTFIDIAWHYDRSRGPKLESPPESVVKQSNEGLFETVSRSLTILNATDIDSGVYSCNVIDLSERTYSVSKSLLVENSSQGSKTINKGNSVRLSYSPLILYCFISWFSYHVQ